MVQNQVVQYTFYHLENAQHGRFLTTEVRIFNRPIPSSPVHSSGASGMESFKALAPAAFIPSVSYSWSELGESTVNTINTIIRKDENRK